ncbi:hypothetical protein SU69_04780 [Thermosipho melanesiensis]|uniref:DUF3352 domain-containing protein n=2 Tax=Thermosipho melanesiensis TaxID=46541 RepID=A6LLJ4_THEM4|nr:hypothetical protein [Thermosipho melanesiensis]ABR30795.1 hypothetical protein Tmel_0934 [Thermosipho melanesiensis BI429]APT73916.1 hypothetical protein BW47_05015 [Thermosipho melanesiensis]OOC35854.1 hypothetical protein SU68_04835 [Thermosipho melanesiensis]OOC38356.1 hypothetical protein SU69_04780 [Thermosipho melanesiensis]OOC38817.1 hypothetical protein SU70_04780 [Thermosipho melanesiensis]
MKKSLIIIFSLFFVFSFSNILNFVPFDYNLFIQFKDTKNIYEDLKKVPFVNFILTDSGLSFENYILNYLENLEYEKGIYKETFLDIFSKNILFLSKGGEIVLDDTLSFDVNYYFDILRNLSKDSAIIFETKNATKVSNYFGKLLDEKVSLDKDTFLIGDFLFARQYEDYYIISGSKTTIDYLISTYNNKDLQFANSNILNNLEKEYWIFGYSKGNALKINFPFTVETSNVNTEYLFFTGKIEDNVLRIKVHQKTNKYYEKSALVDDLMENIPVLGNYFAGITVEDSKEALKIIEPWVFTIESTDLTKFYTLAENIITNSTSTFYVVGDVDDSTSVSVAFLFKLSDGYENIKKILTKYSAKYDKINDEWIIDISEDFKLYFYDYEKFFIVSNIEKNYYSKKAKIQKLMDIAAYKFLDRKRSYDIKVFLDIGDLVYKFLGIKLESKVIFWQEKSGYFINYYLDIM